MSRIEGTWTRFPGEPVPQAELIDLLPRWVEGNALRVATQVFRRASVETRHMLMQPQDLIARGRTFAQKNDLYKVATRVEVDHLCDAIERDTPREARGEIDLLITASCTGFAIPTVDALVMQRLGLPLSLRRVNLTVHGCAAGAASIGMAHEYLTAHPAARALVVCSEFCSLAFQPEDMSGENLVSAAIFGDGSAAVLLSGEDTAPLGRAARPVRVRDTYREFFPGTEHFMGFDVTEAGLKIKLSQDVVSFSKDGLPGVFGRMCDRWHVASPQSFETGSVHPGGRRILEILEDEVGLSTAVTSSSWSCLRRYGNLSSVSVLVSLDHMMKEAARASEAAPAQTLGLISAFGPGFGAEFSLLEAGGLAA